MLSKNPDQVIRTCLAKIVGDKRLYEQYLLEMLLAHPGWSGMARIIEQPPGALLARRDISLKEMIAVELAFLYQKKGRSFPGVSAVPHPDDIPLLRGGALKPKIPLRLKVWHEAMEWSLHSELLLALKPNAAPAAKPVTEVQALFCLDDRECSLRRYLEEINPAIETLGAAGFFGIDFLYQGLDDAYPVAQCPNIIVPKHLVKESGSQPKPDNKSKADDLANMHFTAHSLFRGRLYTQTLGLGYAVRMAWNVFRPGSKLPNIRTLSEVDSHSHLHLLRESDEPTENGYLLGFSLTEMTDRIEGLLRDIGLTQNFAPLVVVVAHGSSSVNNPHFAAYDCGACAGKPGAPNARAFAWMANHEPVRELLREPGIDIPDSTRFVAALHNTSRDEITYFDNHLLEQHPAPGLHAFQQTMKKALQRNARERCRWFELAPQSHANGVEGDLRTGLPSQMIEVHEPARLLIVVEQSRDVLDKAFAKIGALREWLDNDWVRLVSCDPSSRAFFLYTATGWETVELPADCEIPTATHSEKIIVGQTETIPVHQLLRRYA